VAITNAVNIIDVMDGLSAGVCAIGGLAFYALGLLTGNPPAAALAAACIGACAGFLPYNVPPASIFMGDAGSGTIGFLLACVAVRLGYSAENAVALVSPLLILAVPIADTVLVILFRAGAGKPVLRGSRDHFALRLVALGHSPRAAVLMAYAVSTGTGLASLVLVQLRLPGALVVLGITVTLMGAAGLYLARAPSDQITRVRAR
jgi:UDP-GlcNAc:undecaprenyl-phosphate GlcNAc-1-phosphate transferase